MIMMDLFRTKNILFLILFLFPVTILLLWILPVAGSTRTRSACCAFATTVSSRRNWFSRVLSSGLFLSNNNSKHIFDYGPYDDGYVQVSRHIKEEDKQFSLYYRLYNPNSKQVPIVICHGGP